ncbi:MAG: nucleotide exchange factor GrpE [Lachnospiraceae bacterium]|nr:nucleotide exchange factor GrpE [Lachnospiraceae bacterium]
MSEIDEETLDKEEKDLSENAEEKPETGAESDNPETDDTQSPDESDNEGAESNPEALEPDDGTEQDEGSDEADEPVNDDNEPSGTEEGQPKEEKKKFGKKKKDKKDKKDELIEELTDRVKRQMAEFENFRKRTDKEKSSMYEMGAKSVIEKILPVIDNFERGLDTVSDEEKESGFCEGMNKIYKQLLTELENLGVKPIEALGKEFDPNLHNAVMQVDSEEYESGVIAQELQKGYTYRDSVVRHSMVAVVK